MSHKKLAGLLTAAAFALLVLGAGPASALTPGVHSPAYTVSGVNSGSIALGSLISCSTSTVGGTITTDHGSGAGGGGPISSAAWSGCGLGNSAAANNLPWTGLDVTDNDADGVGEATISGVDVTVKALGGLISCRYTGTLTGSYDPTNGHLDLSSSLSSSSGGLCPSSASVSGTYVLTDNSSAGHIPQL